MFTDYHSKYWAVALTSAGAHGSMESLSRSVGNARVDLNPHQVDAALFAVRSPLARGVILADEVGLGKTIEAGIVITQRWAERRRCILVIAPAMLRTQWQEELLLKFSLPSLLLDGQTYRSAARRPGGASPFRPPDQVVVCSYHFAAAHAAEIQAVPWDLVVVDEAHRLRNVYKAGSVLAASVANAIGQAPKILMTATPLQNTLMELYGLVSVVDSRVFGDEISFREQFLRADSDTDRGRRLKERLAPICTRTLRRQVAEYISFTRRVPLTQDFAPSDGEQNLYELVSGYLQREKLYALPAGQRSLLTLILRRLLASSSFAIAGTLRALAGRLEETGAALPLPEAAADFETAPEIEEEWGGGGEAAPRRPGWRQEMALELDDLRRFVKLAEAIQTNAKGEALLTVLETALGRAVALGAARKAVIFTESRRTQAYLHAMLAAAGYPVVLLNGTNADAGSRAIYEAWKAGPHTTSGSPRADLKAALVDRFREGGVILLATESGAEGINLQFCSLVVNYDLPWNPQRIEQRIGRCHRYGQAHDVVVVNFVNRRNAADQRVYQLLSQKFKLFEGVFGASDEVLGAIESGVDLERRIAQVYQLCRTPSEIQAAFDALQAELESEIEARLSETRRNLLENFDAEVHERLRVRRGAALRTLDERQRWLLGLARQEGGSEVRFLDGTRFEYSGAEAESGIYNADWRDAEARGERFYRTDADPAGPWLARALRRDLAPAVLRFSYGAYGQHVGLLREGVGAAGWLEASRLVIRSAEAEEFVVLAGVRDDRSAAHPDFWAKLLLLPASSAPASAAPPLAELSASRQIRLDELVAAAEERGRLHFDEQFLKLERWADDLKLGLEAELRQLDQAIREARRRTLASAALEAKLEAQREAQALQTTRAAKRRQIFESQDKIEAERDLLIGEIERHLQRTIELQPLFTARWILEP